MTPKGIRTSEREYYEMPSRKVIKSALAGFLGTFTSRNTDYQGYWLFGLVEKDIQHCKINLLSPSPADKTPRLAIQAMAVQRFEEQVSKAGLPRSVVLDAELEITKGQDASRGFVGSHATDGHMVKFVARATVSNGRCFETERLVFVAPHDSDGERRRAPEKWGPQESAVQEVGDYYFMTNPEPRILYLKKLVAVARSIVTYQVGLPHGCKRMSAVLLWIKPYDTLQFPIFDEYLEAIREFPSGTSRLYWDRDALREFDKKLELINQKYRDLIFETCYEIIDKYKDVTTETADS